MLQGKKTYLVSLVTVVWAIVGVVLGQLETTVAVNLVLGSGAIAALRNAIK